VRLVGVIAFGLNSAAYVSEIIRAGIQNVNPGQMDAARPLGMPGGLAMHAIILPQAFRNILPVLGNEFVVLLKETSVVGFIGGMDLMRMGDIIRSKTCEAYVPLCRWPPSTSCSPWAFQRCCNSLSGA
jgi:polar amino acid transport system permease protein